VKKIDSFQGEYRWLSNFWFSPIEYSGDRFDTVEHGYQAAKAAEPLDYFRIAHAKTPGEAKRLGKYCILRSDWEQVKDKIMEDLVREKFKIPELREKLLATGDAELIEGNTWNDTYWGRCNGIGKNKLGQILMKIRDEIKNEEK
jgi:ribA/ribD-fused uncharacterized protein